MAFFFCVASGRLSLRARGAFTALALGLVLPPQHMALADGTTALWGKSFGNNAFGQLGDNTTTDRSTPGLIVDANNVLAGKTVTQINAGGGSSCALTSDGGAYCWGSNTGDGTQTVRLTPVAVVTSGALAGKAVTQISGGNGYKCAVTSDGGAYCWGANAIGQLGDGTQLNRLEPVAVNLSGLPAGVTVKQVAAALNPGSHACAVTSDGRAYCWGDNRFGQLGDGTGGTSSLNFSTPFDPRPTPLAVDTSQLPPGVAFTQISTGTFHTCAVTSDGGVYCWGANNGGRLGNGTSGFTTATRPVAVDRSGVLNGKTVIQVAAGGGQTLALTADGAVYGWGSGFASVPVSADSTGVLSGKTVVQISPSFDSVCGVTSDGAGYCWTGTTPAPIDTSGVLSGKFLRQISAASSASRRFPLAEHFAVAAPACGQGIDITSGPASQWHAFSLPQTPSASPATVAAVFGTGTPTNLNTAQYNAANPAAGTGWVIFRRNPVTNAYVRLAATDVLTPGEGYWIRSFQAPRTGKLFVDCPDAAPPATVTQAQGCSSANGCFAITLSTTRGASRYLVGNPFPWGIDWSKARVRVDGSATTFTPSQAAGLAASGNASPPVLGNTFWVWNGASYDSFSDAGPTQGSLPYQKSFWVDLLAGAQGKTVELLIPRDPSTLAQ